MYEISKEEIINALIGGSLIALASSMNLLFTGRITGMSGICFKAFTAPFESFFRWCSILGMILVSSGYVAYFGLENFDSPKVFLGSISLPGFLLGALFVGIGTKMGNGCTSGHGVCGLPRLSIRSYVAVTSFVSSGIIIATLRSYYPFFNTGCLVDLAESFQTPYVYMITCLGSFLIVTILFGYQVLYEKSKEKSNDCIISLATGVIFGLGLIISGMVRRTKILGFLILDKNWDPTLMFVLFSAVGINFITFHVIINKIGGPVIINSSFEIPTNKTIDAQLVLGSCIFGLGWGLSGLCPGPAITILYLYIPHLILFMIVFAIGQVAGDKLTTMLFPPLQKPASVVELKQEKV